MCAFACVSQHVTLCVGRTLVIVWVCFSHIDEFQFFVESSELWVWVFSLLFLLLASDLWLSFKCFLTIKLREESERVCVSEWELCSHLYWFWLIYLILLVTSRPCGSFDMGYKQKRKLTSYQWIFNSLFIIWSLPVNPFENYRPRQPDR